MPNFLVLVSEDPPSAVRFWSATRISTVMDANQGLGLTRDRLATSYEQAITYTELSQFAISIKTPKPRGSRGICDPRSRSAVPLRCLSHDRWEAALWLRLKSTAVLNRMLPACGVTRRSS